MTDTSPPWELYFILCENCGTEILDRRRRFCCTSCKTKYYKRHWDELKEREMNTPGVRPKITWNDIKLDVLKRDDYTCNRCGKKYKNGNGKCNGNGKHNGKSNGNGKKQEQPFHVHHIIPLCEGGLNIMENLETLCEDCHKREHSHVERVRKKHRTLDNFF
jgi:5-methylcytosine-specific restriction endonuclease McrA